MKNPFGQRQIAGATGKGAKGGVSAALGATGLPEPVRTQASEVLYNQLVCQQQPKTSRHPGMKSEPRSRTSFSAGADVALPRTGLIGGVTIKGDTATRKIQKDVTLRQGTDSKVYADVTHTRKLGDNVYVQGGVEVEYREKKTKSTIKGGVKINFP